MLAPDGSVFAHNRKRAGASAIDLNGRSERYTAIVLLGVRHATEAEQRAMLGGKSAYELCDAVVDRCATFDNLGDTALLLWAAAELGHPRQDEVLARLRVLMEDPRHGATVERAWVVSALSAAKHSLDGAAELAPGARATLMRAFNAERGVFAHYVDTQSAPWHRSHVACFADQVYPIQALSLHHLAFGDDEGLAAAEACADLICRVQGPAGQWWWHYDARSGRVLEGYPVYSVHQDSMAPMALFDLWEAGGRDRSDAIRKGLAWMGEAAEIGRSLIDEENQLIWRKVARREPAKLVRKVRAASSRLIEGMHVGLLDAVFPPVTVDHESRPYHLGWVLYAWLTSRASDRAAGGGA